MKWNVRSGLLRDEDENIIAVMPDDSYGINERIMESAPEAIDAIRKFIEEVNSGSLKPRTAVKEFEKILYKYDLA